MACSTFWTDQLTAVKAQIIAYNAAITALASGMVKSYNLNTGQSSQAVTKFDLDKLQADLDLLYTRYDSISARCGNGGTLVSPGY